MEDTKKEKHPGLKGFMASSHSRAIDDGVAEIESNTIADLFPACTVFFGDIAGFTAWSSSREPSQVFLLLQTVYQAFDTVSTSFPNYTQSMHGLVSLFLIEVFLISRRTPQLAQRRRVFKVETVSWLILGIFS